MGREMSLIWVLPFAGMLLSIALMPLCAPHFWHLHFRKVAVGWALLMAAPFLIKYEDAAGHEIAHVFLADYVPFVVLLWTLFTVSGGVLLSGTLVGTPIMNSVLLLVGTGIASWIGTTGASMLMIRPLLKANAHRHHRSHTVVFFIFLVSNIGGLLTPLGDPPLFLGFLHGVPFFWTLHFLCLPFLTATGFVIVLYFLVDSFWYHREPPESRQAALADRQPVRLHGSSNLLLLGGVVGAVLLSGYWKPSHIQCGKWIKNGQLEILTGGEEVATPDTEFDHASPIRRSNSQALDAFHRRGLAIPLQNLAREALLITIGLVSLASTPNAVRSANGFSWFPIKEVAWLFAGIFMTIIPAILILKEGDHGAFAGLVARVETPAHYFWMTGMLSAVLDNAPTYLTFFNVALGRFYPDVPESQAVTQLIGDPQRNLYLIAVATGAVFMGANTYIGNAPNFMVRSIAVEAGVNMPDFFSYIIRYTVPVLIPTFAAVHLLFF